MVTRPFLLLTLLLGLLAQATLSGCAAEPVASEDSGPQRFASLRVVVWSVQTQAAVTAEGVLTSRSDASQTLVKTPRQDPAEGQMLTGLLPGAYRLQINKRLDPSGRMQRVEGLEDVYLEPGQRAEITIVVTDREGELGMNSSPPTVPPSHLPRAAERAAGPG